MNLASEGEYTLPPGEESCWITVGLFAVYIRKTDEGIVVDLFESGSEMDNAIAGTYAFDSEVALVG